MEMRCINETVAKFVTFFMLDKKLVVINIQHLQNVLEFFTLINIIYD